MRFPERDRRLLPEPDDERDDERRRIRLPERLRRRDERRRDERRREERRRIRLPERERRLPERRFPERDFFAHEPDRSFLPLREYLPFRHEHLLDRLQVLAFIELHLRRRPR